jgi:hypothetical protein
MSEPYDPPSAPPPTVPPPGGPPAYGAPGLPWDRDKNGNTLVETVKALVTAPGRAYAEMREKGDYLSPILFAVILGTFGGVIGQIWQLVFGASMAGFLPPEMQGPFAEALAPSVTGVILTIVLTPILVPIFLFISAGIFHLFLMLVGGTKDSTAGFEGTVRAVAYAGVANLAQVIPLAGGFIAAVWGIVLYVIGLSRVHHTSTGKAALAVLLPFVLCCICIAIAFATMGAAIFAAFEANQ